MSESREIGIERIIDANLNRLREGIRVIEDVMRYAKNDSRFSPKLKMLRHEARLSLPVELLAHRDVVNDVSKKSFEDDLKRENLDSILVANFKRAQESARVLEETLKLMDERESEHFKAIRYELYGLEKAILSPVQPLI
ncbi:hypothetical protein [Wolinella succinogenes]|uniref:ThiD2 domain-containing protein n=1 Tax=Wolinella succinogenes (strain ATCC 29543 / DSM 1740 / CCUG 13145 / JCM 31913 / LMG 7466 / NCTC 11488 / FDC 602W) TaxID=273121 RepID=Q7MSL0_WOLSU|nr:hypothetical protein [Wolinella succinogenes]CAE09497.1 hypothetical protein WS0347 [Wolinella succinogenes]VEG81710.1 thiamine-phosphate pyrophosphorylase [Wolinella succinogenes]HCZ18384.1 thiamine-phosphate pyrophosphorylase [Helicobacter sp.]